MEPLAAEIMFEALLKEDQKLGPARFLAQFLSKVLQNGLTGINALEPNTRAKAQELQRQAGLLGIKIKFTETWRSAELQNKYYAKGRSAGGSVITNAKAFQSYHNYGLAFDICIDDAEPYPNNVGLWKQLGGLGQKLGLVWGGDWGDFVHFEYHPGFSWKDLETYFS